MTVVRSLPPSLRNQYPEFMQLGNTYSLMQPH